MAQADVNVRDLPNAEACVICLDRLTERAIALPCKHDQFDFGCLGTWLHQQQVCPLCKGNVTAVKYDLGEADGGTIFTLPEQPSLSPSPELRHRRLHPYHSRHDEASASSVRARGRTRVSRWARPQVPPNVVDSAVAFRRRVYREQLYSLRVGSNRISHYQNLTPASFASNDALTKRAKAWIRRELSAFDFLNPSSPSFGQCDRRASNAEFLLEYVVAILKSIDLRGSQGQAESLLKDFLGQTNARLFLHELEAFLRSPFERLEHWDANVQYGDPTAADGMHSSSRKQLKRSRVTTA